MAKSQPAKRDISLNSWFLCKKNSGVKFSTLKTHSVGWISWNLCGDRDRMVSCNTPNPLRCPFAPLCCGPLNCGMLFSDAFAATDTFRNGGGVPRSAFSGESAEVTQDLQQLMSNVCMASWSIILNTIYIYIESIHTEIPWIMKDEVKSEWIR